jgi:ATP-dependent helicase HrpB
LLLELLSPAKRPIQVTQDLVKFWSGSYQAVQKDMKSRYPKHYWPDDPANAKATNKTKKHIR